MKRFKTVEEFLDNQDAWQDELIRLREILNSTKLEETVKWGLPTYTHNGKIVVGFAGFKNHFGLWFHQGALLDDQHNYLINAQEGKTKAMRQWRMTKKSDIKARHIKSYVKQSIELIEAGKEIKADRSKPIVIPDTLNDAFKNNKSAKASFAKLTKGKQREYADYISDAKRTETKLKRIDKIVPMIEQGIGLNDKYRNC